MTERDGFIAAIVADPANMDKRFAFADWLEQQGEPALAQIIRVQARHTVTFAPMLPAEPVYAAVRFAEWTFGGGPIMATPGTPSGYWEELVKTLPPVQPDGMVLTVRQGVPAELWTPQGERA